MVGSPVNNMWSSTKKDEFDAFRVSPAYISTHTPSSISTPLTSRLLSGNISICNNNSPADIFRRGIQKDPTLFPTLKDENFHDSWHRSFVNQAKAQDVSEGIEASYKPNYQSEMDFFTEKQKYVYAILKSNV
jgi:hypothetical protein